MSADFAHALGAITPEYAEAAGGEVEFVIKGDWLCEQVNEHTCGTERDGYYGAHEPGCGLVPIANISDLLADDRAATRQAAADAVLAAARRLCCGDNPAPEHSARADHSQRMAFAEELARAVRHA